MSTTQPEAGAFTGPFHLDFDAIDWVDERKLGKASVELIEQAEKLGARRKRMATGECGFFMNFSTMPAGYTVPTHRHGHDELIMVIEGGATVAAPGLDGDGIVLEKGDAIVLEGGFEYGFTCGDDGMQFVTIRTEDSTTTTTS
jgi:quercetin dioxygenase-like cupin family protein